MESIVVKESFKVTLLDTGESFNCTSQQHVLSAMSKMGKKGIPSGCHGGGCGVCKVKIMEGTYHTKKMSRAHVSIEEENAGCALACRVFPTSALSMNVIGKLQKNILKKTN